MTSAGDPHRPGQEPDSFVRTDWRPAYAGLLQAGALEERVARAREHMTPCTACPHACGADRLSAPGDCGSGAQALVASAFAHQGEETCLVGRRGSGTIFFSRCNLACVFCQNWDLSQRDAGRECSPAQLADLALALQDWGCHNINLVSPSHVVPQIVEAIALAAGRGLEIPVVYNTNGYDSSGSLQLLEGLVDIYMPDFKFWEEATAARYCGAADYPARARRALAEMHRQVGRLTFDADGVAVRGLLVRHLVLPGLADEAAAIMAWLAREISVDTFVNIMEQYRPCYLVGESGLDGSLRYGELNRRPQAREMEQVRSAARAAGLWRFA